MHNLHPVRVSRKRRTIAIAVSVLVICAVAYFILIENALLSSKTRAEPQFRGVGLSKWLRIWTLQGGSTDSDLAQQAILSIGTNGLPYLLRWMTYETPPWCRMLADSGPFRLRFFLLSRQYRANDTARGFFVLGTNAAPAIPALAVLARSTNAQVANRAIFALCGIGDVTLPVVSAILKDPNAPHRHLIPVALKQFNPERRTTNLWVPVLVEALSDTNVPVHTAATEALQYLAPEALTSGAAK